MWYLVLYGILAVWVLADGFSRQLGGEAVLWAIGTGFFGPIVLPVYMAKRPLKKGEVREGGTGWNVLKNFAILWTILMAVACFAALLGVSQATANLQSDAERAGAGLGIFIGMGFLFAVWIVPTLGAALLGFLLKKNTIVETGPTGPLAETVDQAGFGWGGLLAAAVLAIVVVGVVSSASHGTPNTNSGASKTASASLGSDTPPDTSSAPSSRWRVSEKTNDMDGKKSVTLRLDADNEIRGVIGKHRPYLAIQCQDRKADVVVEIGKPLQHEYGEYDTYPVRMKFDEGAPIRQRWLASTDRVAIFSPSGQKLTKQLSQSKSFLIEFTPFEETAETVRFTLDGLTPFATQIESVCGLKL